jgi:hypothetical protein
VKPEFIAAAKGAKSRTVNFTDAIAKVFASTHATDLHRTRGRRSHGWSGWIAPPRELIALQELSKKHMTRRLALSTRFRSMPVITNMPVHHEHGGAFTSIHRVT